MAEFLAPIEGSRIDTAPTDAITGVRAGVFHSVIHEQWSTMAIGTMVARSNIVQDADGYAYVVTASSLTSTTLTLRKFSPAGYPVASYAIGFATVPGDLIYASDDRIWMPEPGTADIHAFNPATGLWTAYTVAGLTLVFGTGQLTNAALVEGADGNLWVAEYDPAFIAAERFAVINMSGVLQAQHNNGSWSNATTLVLGPDDRIWYASGTQVEAINTSGTVTAYTLDGAVIHSVHRGSNGSMYAVTGSGIIKFEVDGGTVLEYLAFPEPLKSSAAVNLPRGHACEFDDKLFIPYGGRVLAVDLVEDEVISYETNAVVDPVRLITFESESIIGVDLTTGLPFRYWPDGAASTTISVEGKAASSVNPVPVYSAGSTKATYMATSGPFTPGATPEDVFTITGSGTKVVKVLGIWLTTEKDTGSTTDAWYLKKRSAANSGGTSAACTAVPLDSASPPATATVLSYTADPTLGNLVGSIASYKLAPFDVATAGQSTPIHCLFNAHLSGQPVVLRSVNEVLAVNHNNAALPAGLVISATVLWTEE